jgi:hypothetical protein
MLVVLLWMAFVLCVLVLLLVMLVTMIVIRMLVVLSLHKVVAKWSR